MSLAAAADLATVIAAAIAVVAALFAGWQVREIRRTRDEQSRPFVIVDIQPSAAWMNLLNLVVQNLGPTLARDVRISFEPPLTTSITDVDLDDMVLLTQGIASLPPGRRIQTFLDTSHGRLEAKLPMKHEATVRFSDARGRPQEPLTYVIDLTYLYGLEFITEYGVHDAAKALQEIQKSIKGVVSGGQRVHVSARDERREALEARITRSLTGQSPSMGRKPPPEILMVLGRNVLFRTAYGLVRRWRERLARRLTRRGGSGVGGGS